jgi:pimeloyl-ACP methyl ester carboxylesterase
MTNKKLNGVHVCESSEKQRACHQGQVKARPRDASGTGMKNQKLDAAEVWRQMEDLAAPQLRQTVHERAVYSYLLRHSRIEGKVRLRFSISWLRHGAGLPIRAARKAIRGLAAKGALRVVGRGREGHVVEVRLPEEIRGVHAREIAGDRAARAREIDNLEAADFLGGPELQLVSGVGLFSVGAGPFVVPPPFAPLVQQLQLLAEQGVDRFPLNADQFYALGFGTDPITGKPTMSPDVFATLVSLDFASPTASDADSIAAIGELISPVFFMSPAAPAWGTIQVPALVVDGALDPLVGGDNAQALYDALGSGRKQLMVFPRNGHGWFLEDNYAATLRVLDRFLSQF